MRKLIVGLFAVILLIFIGLGVMAFVSPTAFSVEREIVVSKPRAEVFAYLKPLKNQTEWSWMKKDPAMKLTFEGTEGEVGSIMKWESKGEPGVGEQEIKKIVDGERIEYEMRFKTPWESTNQSWVTTSDAGEGKTKVSSGFSGEMPRPINLMLLFTDFEEIVGEDFEQGLAEFKKVVESRN